MGGLVDGLVLELFGPFIDRADDIHHLEDGVGILGRRILARLSPRRTRVAEGRDLELGDAGLGPDHGKGGAVGDDGVVRLNAMGQEMTGAGSFAPVIARLIGTDGGAGYLAGHGGEDEVPLHGDAAHPDRLAGDHEGGEPAFHVRGAEAVHLAVSNHPPELFGRLQFAAQNLVLIGTGEAGVHVAVDHQGGSAAASLDDADGIDPLGIDFLADGLDAVSLVPIEDEFADFAFVAGRARNIDEIPGQRRQLVPGDMFEDFLSLLLGVHGCPLSRT